METYALFLTSARRNVPASAEMAEMPVKYRPFGGVVFHVFIG